MTGLGPDEALQELVRRLEAETGLHSLEVLELMVESLQDLIEEQSENADAVARLTAALVQVNEAIDRRRDQRWLPGRHEQHRGAQKTERCSKD